MIARLLCGLLAGICWLATAPAFADSATGSSWQATLAPGLCSGAACSGYNNGSQTFANGGTISPQLFYVSVSTPGSQTVTGTDGGKLWTATVSGVTFSVFSPGANGSSGVIFGYDGSHGYSIASSATIYGCGPSGTTINANYAASLTSDGTNWQCTPLGSVPVGMMSKTTSYTVLPTDNGTHFDNVGAAGAVVLTLPVAAPELSFCFTADVSGQTLTALAVGSDKIYSNASPPVNGAAAGNVHSNSPGSTVCLESHKAGQWYPVSVTGSWIFS